MSKEVVNEGVVIAGPKRPIEENFIAGRRYCMDAGIDPVGCGILAGKITPEDLHDLHMRDERAVRLGAAD